MFRAGAATSMPLGRLTVALGLVTCLACASGAAKPVGPAPAPEFGEAFWSHWGDGRAELAGYDLTFPRYGAPRAGTAVAIFVNETFSDAERVKAETPEPAADRFPVMKLNLVQDFATGIYDYNLMTSTFVALTERHDRPPGSPAKVSFSSQEWCGHVYAQLLFDAGQVRYTSHSYFEGEADEQGTVEYPPDGVAEDALLLWARGMAAPVLEPGESRELPVLTSLERRLVHVDGGWEPATLSRATGTETIEVPAGAFEVFTQTARIGDRTWTFRVEAAPPHRLVQWTRSDGFDARLLAVDRLPYWQLNGSGGEQQLERLGLTPRPPRTP